MEFSKGYALVEHAISLISCVWMIFWFSVKVLRG